MAVSQVPFLFSYTPRALHKVLRFTAVSTPARTITTTTTTTTTTPKLPRAASTTTTARLPYPRQRIPNSHPAFSTTTTTTAAKMSSMPAQPDHSAACCNIPPIQIKGYQEKGNYEGVGETPIYVTGPPSAKKGILVIYDIFGYFPQTLQGADILAYGSKAEKYLVVMPDWFRGEACPIEWYPPDTDQKQKDLGEWFSHWPPSRLVNQLPGLVESLKEKYPATTEWAIVGYCWGGKVASIIGATDLFRAVASCHPGMIDSKDAEAIKAPTIMLASMDEDTDDVAKFEAALKVPHHVETFSDQIHGWMAARGDLENDRVREEYERGYKLVLDFFDKHI